MNVAIALLLPNYLLWHYSQGLRDGVVIWKNYLWFLNRLFSIPTMLGSLFAPWKRLGERYKRGLGAEEFVQVLIVNVVMRLVGAVARLVLAIFGLITLGAWVVFGGVLFVFWVAAPFICGVLFFVSLGVLIQLL